MVGKEISFIENYAQTYNLYAYTYPTALQCIRLLSHYPSYIVPRYDTLVLFKCGDCFSTKNKLHTHHLLTTRVHYSTSLIASK